MPEYKVRGNAEGNLKDLGVLGLSLDLAVLSLTYISPEQVRDGENDETAFGVPVLHNCTDEERCKGVGTGLAWNPRIVFTL